MTNDIETPLLDSNFIKLFVFNETKSFLPEDFTKTFSFKDSDINYRPLTVKNFGFSDFNLKEKIVEEEHTPEIEEPDELLEFEENPNEEIEVVVENDRTIKNYFLENNKEFKIPEGTLFSDIEIVLGSNVFTSNDKLFIRSIMRNNGIPKKFKIDKNFNVRMSLFSSKLEKIMELKNR